MSEKREPIVEAKVKVSALAATVAGLVLSLVSHTLGEVPDVLAGTIETAVTGLVTGGVTFAGGWLARHTPRELLDVDVDRSA